MLITVLYHVLKFGTVVCLCGLRSIYVVADYLYVVELGVLHTLAELTFDTCFILFFRTESGVYNGFHKNPLIINTHHHIVMVFLISFLKDCFKNFFVFVNHIDEDIAYSRMISRGQPLSRREKKGQPLMRVLRKGFLDMISSTTDKFEIIDTGHTSIEELEECIGIIDQYVK